MINKIKNSLIIGSNIKLTVNLGRNKYETINGVINELYSNVFIVKTEKGNKCFSYNDILTGLIRLNN